LLAVQSVYNWDFAIFHLIDGFLCSKFGSVSTILANPRSEVKHFFIENKHYFVEIAIFGGSEDKIVQLIPNFLPLMSTIPAQKMQGKSGEFQRLLPCTLM